MPHPESVTTVLTDNEPPNGTILFVRSGEEWTVIQRDDEQADDCEPGEHWFPVTAEAIGVTDPMTLHELVKDADAVYALGEQLAVFS